MANSTKPKSTPTRKPSRPSARKISAAQSRAIAEAIRRCDAAWARAYRSFLADYDEPYGVNEKVDAEILADKVYCRNIPPVTGEHGVACYLACVTHGVLVGVIPPERAGVLLYAAQVGKNTFGRGRKSRSKQ